MKMVRIATPMLAVSLFWALQVWALSPQPAPLSNARRMVDAAAQSMSAPGSDGTRSAANQTQPLVMGPLPASTFLGGEVYDHATSIAVDSGGNIYVAGWTETQASTSAPFPTTPGAYKTSGNYVDAFVAKFDANLENLLASTLLGGGGYDAVYAIAIDAAGNVYVAGRTDSGDFPTTAGAYETQFGGWQEGFVAKLDSNLETLLASTFLGGDRRDAVYAMALDNSQNVYVTGRTESSDFPTTDGAFNTAPAGGFDAFVSKLDSNLQNLLASAYLGGTEIESGRAIAIDSASNVYVTGYTWSGDFPTTSGVLQDAAQGGFDGFVSKLDGNLQALLASTYLGGSSWDYAYSLAVDGGGDVFVTGISKSSDFPTTAGAYATTHSAGYDAYVSRLDGNLQALLASTYLGGSGGDYAYSLAIDPTGDVFLSGMTLRQAQGTAGLADFPTTPNAYDTSYHGGQVYGGYGDAFVSKLDPDLATLLAATYLGGSGHDETRALVTDASGNVFVAGVTWSLDWPATAGAYDTAFNGNYDAFVARLNGDLSGSAAPQDALVVAPTSHDFGSVDVGSVSPAQSFAVTNTGAISLSLETLVISGTNASEFNIQDDNCSGQTLDPSAACTVGVTFSPAWEGSKSATLSIPVNAPGSTIHEVLLSGTGVVQRYTLTVHRTSGMGRVRNSGGGIHCGTDCTEAVNAGAQVTLRAQPFAGATFAGWSGGGCSGTGDCVVTMDADVAVTATFDAPLAGVYTSPDALWYVVPPEANSNVIPLKPGWNLVRLPHEPLDPGGVETQLAAIQDSVYGVWGWDRDQDAWRLYAPGLPLEEVAQQCDAGVLPLTRLEGGRGYWFHMAQTDTLQLAADPSSPTLPVSGAGWHLHGVEREVFEGGALLSPSDVLSLTFATQGSIWGWDADAQQWQVFSTEATLEELQQLYGGDLLALESLGPRDGFWLDIAAQDIAVFQSPDPNPRGMFYDGQYIYVQGLHNRQTYRLDLGTGAVVTTFNQGLGGTDATWDGEYAWGMGWSIVQKLKIEGDQLVPVVQYEMRPYLHHMAGIASDGQFLWLGGFFKLDPDHVSQEEILEETDSGLAYITQMEWVGNYLYALDGSKFLYVLDPNDPRGPFQIAQTYALPGEKPSGLAWDGANLWVSDEETGLIYKIPGTALGGRSYDLMDDYLKPDDTPTVLQNYYVDSDTTLTKAESPYVLNGGLTVAAGVTLTIEPGVRLLFPEYSGVSVNGRLVAIGTPQEPIIFSHVDPDTRWSGVMVDPSGDPSQPQSVFRYCRIQHADRGIESRNAPIDVQHCWMRGMPTGLNAPPGGIQIEVANGLDARVAGNVAPNIAMYLGSGNPAQVTVEDNRGSFIFLRSGYTANPASVRRNLLDGGIVVEGATNLEMEGNQLGRPLECTPTADAPVTFNGNLIETDYQINGLCRDGTSFTARHNTVTNGFSLSWADPAADLLSLLDIHFNNILGGANYFLPAEVNIASTQTVDLSQNWWGTTDTNEVRALINDQEDDPNRGRAISNPILTAPDPYGFVRGRVFDADTGRPLPEATVEISGTNKMVSADGYFATTLPVGTYTVTATASGYQTVTLAGVTVVA
ncbi:MAG: SBBP repeat-containing protein, partial [Anaerolineae bacterium]